MAPSKLYDAAVASLGPSRAQWEAVTQRIAATEGPDLKNQSGAAILANIQAEEQLSPNPAAADTGKLADALRALAATTWPTEAGAFEEAYCKAVEPFQLQGTRIQSSPSTLYRYMNGSGFLIVLASALRAAGAPRFARVLEHLIGDAGRGGPNASWDIVIGYLRKDEIWAILIANNVLLARPGARSMFVTFDLDPRPDRRSARWLHAALALWLDRQACFLELSYPARTDDQFLFPTFADAGWFRHFRSAPVGQPHGWTRPHRNLDPVPDPQPEAVQAPPTLIRLPSPSHLRAVPP